MATLGICKPPKTAGGCSTSDIVIIVRANEQVDIVAAQCLYDSADREERLLAFGEFIKQIRPYIVEEYIDCPRIPLFVCNDKQGAIVIRNGGRAAGIYAVINVSQVDSIIGDNDIFGEAAARSDGFFVIPFLAGKKIYDRAEIKIGSIVDRIYYDNECANRSTASIINCSYTLAELLGMTIVTSCTDGLAVACEDIDMDLNSAMLLMLFMLFARTAERGSVGVEVKFEADMCIVCVRAKLNKCAADSFDSNAELAECARIAARYAMIFDYAVTTECDAEVRFSAARSEWSYVGIKTRAELEYEE